MLNLDLRNGSEGSRYTVFPEGAVAYPSPSARLGRERKRILLVDSQPIFRFGVRTVLEAAGYEVVGEAASAAEAVCAAETHEPELIILDIDLAQGDAIELVRQLTETAFHDDGFGVDHVLRDTLRRETSRRRRKRLPFQTPLRADAAKLCGASSQWGLGLWEQRDQGCDARAEKPIKETGSQLRRTVGPRISNLPHSR